MTRRASPSTATVPPADQPAIGGGAPPSHPALIELARALARLAVDEDIRAGKTSGFKGDEHGK